MEKSIEILQKSKAKVTRPRKMVLEILNDTSQPMSISEIFSNCTDIDFASVFRTIQLFLSLEIVREINMLDKQIRYELTQSKPHHHILCNRCGKIEKIDVCILDDIKRMTRFKITNHMMEFAGLCPECMKES